MRWFVMLLFIVTFFSCRSTEVNQTTANQDAINSKEYIGIITKMNEKAIGSFEGSFYIDGTLNKKKYKTLGTALFNRIPRKMNVTITDFIFKSPISILVQEDTVLNVYYPVEKKLFVDNIGTIQLKNYSEIDFPFSILYEFFTGSIPLLKNYRIKNCIFDKDKKNHFLIVENDSYFETISFINKIPDKVLFVDKNNKTKIEFYLARPATLMGTLYFRTIKIIAKDNGIDLAVVFNKIKFNSPVAVKSIIEMKLPQNLTIIKM